MTLYDFHYLFCRSNHYRGLQEQHFQGPEDITEKKNHQLFEKHTYCFIFLIKNLEALLSDKELRKALLQSNCKRADSKLEFLQDGIAYPITLSLLLIETHNNLSCIVMK